MSTSRATPMRFGEFVALAAATMASQAVAIDSMLPALPIIVQSLHVADPNHGQWVVTAYVSGLGVGQLFWGVMSDRFGRRPILLSGLCMYVMAALVCSLSTSFPTLLAARFVHGLAAACVTVMRSVVRDLYSGRDMARVMSLTFMVFMAVPVIAPSVGQIIMLAAPWRYIFGAMGLFAGGVALWLMLRLPETLHAEYRLTLDPSHVARSVRMVLGNRISLGYTLAMTAMFGSIMAYVGMVQQVFSGVFHRPALMPAMFALAAVFMSASAYANSRLVQRLGMRRISHLSLLAFITVTGVHTVAAVLGYENLWSFAIFQAVTMVCFGPAVSNFGAMAMEPVGAVAGVAASLQGFISTFFGALLGACIGWQFNGTTVPVEAGAMGCGLAALLFVLIAERGRLFSAHHAADGVGMGAQVEGAGLH